MALNCIWWWYYSHGALKRVECPLITITLKVLWPGVVGPVKFLSMDQIIKKSRCYDWFPRLAVTPSIAVIHHPVVAIIFHPRSCSKLYSVSAQISQYTSDPCDCLFISAHSVNLYISSISVCMGPMWPLITLLLIMLCSILFPIWKCLGQERKTILSNYLFGYKIIQNCLKVHTIY